MQDAPGATGSMLTEFHPFGALHALAAGVAAGVMVLLVVAGRWAQRRGREDRVRAGWIGASVVVQGASAVYYVVPPNLVPAESLPLHICDLAGWIAVAALATRWRIMRTLLYFWGIGLSTQAFFTPVLGDEFGVASLRFWLFFGTHLQIVGSAVYDIAVLGYRPRMKDFLAGSMVTMGYVAVLIPLNMATGWNYAYVGQSKPENPTPIDLLGPWPLRLVWMALIVHGLFGVMTLAWRVRRRRRVMSPAAPMPRSGPGGNG
ncbi:MAG: TIGR02206 family membrane protein [Planctomycetota bacterium]|nr:TIGR02206 family membrane protein [Planctomycetota bacterium]